MSFFAELKRRNVVKVSLAYLGLGWLVIEVTTTVPPSLNLPAWLPQVVVWIGIIVFPFVAVFSWVFELSPDRLRRESELAAPSAGARVVGRRLDYVTLGLFALALLVFAADRFAARTPAPPIAVLPFENFSSDPAEADFADGLAADLITRLSSWRAFPVISRNSSFTYRGGDADLKHVSESLGARCLVEGSVTRPVWRPPAACWPTFPITDFGQVFVAMNAVGLGRLDEARAATDEARRTQPALSLQFVQGMHGVARPEIDARRNAVLRQARLV